MKKEKKFEIQKLFPILIIIATCFMGIGYAAINSITLDISGNLIATNQNGVFITDAVYVPRTGELDNESASIKSINGTTLNSTITLKEDEMASKVSIKVSFYNNSNNDYMFTGIEYAEELVGEMQDIYSNQDITYTYNKKESIIEKNGGTLDVTITFNYSIISKDTTNILNSILNFKFNKIFYITYNSIKNVPNLPTYVLEGEDVNINFSSTTYFYFAIFMGENKLVINSDYTYKNMILNIPNVNADLTISSFGAVTDGLITLSNEYINTSNMYGDFEIMNENNFESSFFCKEIKDCYSDNNGLFQYDSNGGLVLDQNNTIGSLRIDESMSVKDEYTAYITLKANTNQCGIASEGDDCQFGATVIAISQISTKYLLWISFYNNYLHVYSYYNGYAKSLVEEPISEEGFLSTSVQSYSNKIINIQIVGIRNGTTKVYINGNLFTTFNSGKEVVEYKSATLGDLRPGRNLRFTGTIYDVALYKRALTEEEIQINWNYANTIYGISP